MTNLNHHELTFDKIDQASLTSKDGAHTPQLFACAYDLPKPTLVAQHAKDKPQTKDDPKLLISEAHDVAAEKFTDKTKTEFQHLFNKLSHAKGADADTIFAGLQHRGAEINAELIKEGKPERINLACAADTKMGTATYYFLVNAKDIDLEKSADYIYGGKPVPSVTKVGTFVVKAPADLSRTT